ncbi:hypothetical protein [Asanoa siamensis]|uniref:Uncharacterized protein n=1 Tax=Asanoa siamensis TaxID=926357 RepID=A0ABQ4CZN3_9ACTN|nr:hypothetical protein [Asanoa siamensis]GIF76734.1 hypothetical protein Asi02nite_62520 [Asanoa siamensis]
MTDLIHIRIDVSADADDDRLARMSRDLRAELLEGDVESVTRPSGPPPAGAKSAEALTAGALLLAVAPPFVEGAVAVVASWLSRQARDVTVEIDGQTFSGPVTRQQRDALVQAYLARVATEPAAD